MTNISSPLHSLREGHWFKLICGASFQHLPAVRNLTLAYTLAGADCIDVAADPAAIAAAQEALQTAAFLGSEAQQRGFGFQGVPLLMVSLNDGEDPHFRKAEFNSTECPTECPRPCESICPAGAIVFDRASVGFSGVLDRLCYGCGRCLPICPSKLIFTRSYVSTPEAVAPLVLENGVDAVEIHTQVGRLQDFARLWGAIAPSIHRLKLVAISCPDGEGLIDYLRAIYQLIKPLPCPLIWQTDGRPMSGDIGAGTTHAAIKLGQKVLGADLPGYVQLAGGTNSHTVTKLKAIDLLGSPMGEGEGEGKNFPLPIDRRDAIPTTHYQLTGETQFLQPTTQSPVTSHQSPVTNPKKYISGIAYGSYARVMLSPILDLLETTYANEDFLRNASMPPQRVRLEDKKELLWQAVALADSLVSQLKSHYKVRQSTNEVSM